MIFHTIKELEEVFSKNGHVIVSVHSENKWIAIETDNGIIWKIKNF